MSDSVDDAATAVRTGHAVVYPTETVYGLGADATDPDAVEHVFDLKGRSRENPLSLAIPSVDAALDYTRPTDVAEQFMRRFLPGPVTVVVARRPALPDALTAGRDRVGVRVPAHETALDLLDRTPPLTATSANRSGSSSVTRVAALDDRLREGVAAVVDGGVTPGTESTVVDPAEGVIHRRGAMADDIEAWLETQ